MNRTSPSFRSGALPAPSGQLLRACYRPSMLTAHPFTMLPSSSRAILRSPGTSPPGPCGTCMPFTRSHHRGAVSVPCCHGALLIQEVTAVDAYDRRVPISRWNGQPTCRAVPEDLTFLPVRVKGRKPGRTALHGAVRASVDVRSPRGWALSSHRSCRASHTASDVPSSLPSAHRAMNGFGGFTRLQPRPFRLRSS